MRRLLALFAGCICAVGVSLFMTSAASAAPTESATSTPANQAKAKLPGCRGHYKPSDPPCTVGKFGTAYWTWSGKACHKKGRKLVYNTVIHTRKGPVGWYWYDCQRLPSGPGKGKYHLVMAGYVPLK